LERQPPDSRAKLSPDLANLAALIYHNNNKPKRAVYENPDPDGTVSWQSLSPLGYTMEYFTGMSASAGGLEVDIHAGGNGPSSNKLSSSLSLLPTTRASFVESFTATIF
jgi:hypothetical protein